MTTNIAWAYLVKSAGNIRASIIVVGVRTSSTSSLVVLVVCSRPTVDLVLA